MGSIIYDHPRDFSDTLAFIAGNALIGSGSQRVMQVGLKLTF